MSSKRKRYCDIKATSLKDILETCERHIKNINLTALDFADCEDGTETDNHYMGMIRETWSDLRDDVVALLKKEKQAAKKIKKKIKKNESYL